jgi:hypothetical protein
MNENKIKKKMNEKKRTRILVGANFETFIGQVINSGLFFELIRHWKLEDFLNFASCSKLICEHVRGFCKKQEKSFKTWLDLNHVLQLEYARQSSIDLKQMPENENCEYFCDTSITNYAKWQKLQRRMAILFKESHYAGSIERGWFVNPKMKKTFPLIKRLYFVHANGAKFVLSETMADSMELVLWDVQRDYDGWDEKVEFYDSDGVFKVAIGCISTHPFANTADFE